VDILWLESRSRVWAVVGAIEAIQVQRCWFDALEDDFKIPACAPGHGNEALMRGQQVHLN
jgi:hypothetical protein